MSCENEVEQQIACGPYGMDSKTIISKCGTTGNDGEQTQIDVILLEHFGVEE